MTKGELTARRNTTEFFEKRRRHARASDKIAFFVRSKRWWELRIEYWKESEEWVKFVLPTEDIISHQKARGYHPADLERAIQLQTQLQRKIRRLPADPVAKKQKTEPRKAKGSWGGARRGPGFEASKARLQWHRRAKGGEGEASERINMHLRALIWLKNAIPISSRSLPLLLVPLVPG
jgi:hypothetical protein